MGMWPLGVLEPDGVGTRCDSDINLVYGSGCVTRREVGPVCVRDRPATTLRPTPTGNRDHGGTRATKENRVLRKTTPRWRITALTAVTALALAACGGSGTDDTGATEGNATDATTDSQPDPQDADTDPADVPDTSEPTDVEDDANEGDADAPALQASDGWGQPADVEVPDPGNGVLTLAGEEFAFEAECAGPGEVPDHFMDGAAPVNDYVIFNFLMRGNGQLEDGQSYSVAVERAIVIDGDRWLNLQHSGFGGDGQISVVSLSYGQDGVSRVQTPSSQDPEGSLLPMVEADESGVVTAAGELTHEFEGDITPEGEFTLAAQCQTGWPDDVIDAQR